MRKITGIPRQAKKGTTAIKAATRENMSRKGNQNSKKKDSTTVALLPDTAHL